MEVIQGSVVCISKPVKRLAFLKEKILVVEGIVAKKCKNGFISHVDEYRGCDGLGKKYLSAT